MSSLLRKKYPYMCVLSFVYHSRGAQSPWDTSWAHTTPLLWLGCVHLGWEWFLHYWCTGALWSAYFIWKLWFSHNLGSSLIANEGMKLEPEPKMLDFHAGSLQDVDPVHDRTYPAVLPFAGRPLLLTSAPLTVSPTYNITWSLTRTHNSSVQSLSHVWFFVTPRTAAHQASLSITNSWSLLKLMSMSRWCHPTISSSIVPFSSLLQSFPASGSVLMSQFFSPTSLKYICGQC